jgi:hypothetical protein
MPLPFFESFARGRVRRHSCPCSCLRTSKNRKIDVRVSVARGFNILVLIWCKRSKYFNSHNLSIGSHTASHQMHLLSYTAVTGVLKLKRLTAGATVLIAAGSSECNLRPFYVPLIENRSLD